MKNTLADLPKIAKNPSDLHLALRSARQQAPLALDHQGIVLALHARHLDQVLSPSLTRQLETEVMEMQGITDGPIFDNNSAMLLWANGNVHVRRRRALTRTFAHKLMEGMRPRARAIAEQLVSERIGSGPIDFLDEVAAQIPARIIAEILGIPQSDLPYFRALVDDVMLTVFTFDPAQRTYLEGRMLEFFDYANRLIAERRLSPRDDFLTRFADQSDQTDPLSDEELRSNLIGLILAGSDTTKNSIAVTVSLLLDRPDQWQMLVQDPERWKRSAAMEGQRYEPVAIGVPRVAVTAFDLDGYTIEPGTTLMFSIVSASRDPDMFSDPDSFDITRTDHPRWAMGFGGGAHRCIGEALAWVEIEETLSALARLAPNTTRTGPAPAVGSLPTRMIDQLELMLG
ncbi:cytochrome P450 [Sphingobium sp. HWE2-09]|uniref:cytochrome P450 n=1 Tax=Sphingobium sp. HWE2-09 TaxID=3108390 RepID=UPI002DD336FD|nr:cytochrome P450 [Sphingobium sp. HWE2-09]